MKKALIFLGSMLLAVCFCYSENQYTDKWPTINANIVNGRDYPDTTIGTVLFQLKKEQKISIKYKLDRETTINGNSNYWYYVSIESGDNANSQCWVFGQYISFTQNYDETYWNNSLFPIQVIDVRIAYIHVFVNKALDNLYGEVESGRYSLDRLYAFKLTNAGESTLWYMKESGYKEMNTYNTPAGELIAFVNKGKNRWAHIETIISKKYDKFGVRIGMSVSDLEQVFGNYYTQNGNLLEYRFNQDFDSYFLSFKVENNIVTAISIRTFFD